MHHPPVITIIGGINHSQTWVVSMALFYPTTMDIPMKSHEITIKSLRFQTAFFPAPAASSPAFASSAATPERSPAGWGMWGRLQRKGLGISRSSPKNEGWPQVKPAKVGDVCDHQCVFLGDLWEIRERKVMYFEEFSGILGIWWRDFRDVYGFIGTSWREFTLTNNSSDPHSRDCNFTSKNRATCKMWGIHQNSSHPLNIEQPHSMVPIWKFPTKNHGFV